MKRFKYTAKSLDGQSVSGVVEAAEEKQAVNLLRERNLIVTKISSASNLDLFSSIVNHVGVSALANFTRQLSTMISAGLNLVEALTILENQTDGYLGKVIDEIRRDVESGRSLAESMGKHEKVFDSVYIALIKAGEKAGVLDQVLIRLADNLEKKREFQSKVRNAMIYPVIIVIGLVVVMIVMLVYVIPQLGDLYKEFEADLPFITTSLIAVSNLVATYWYVFAIIGVFSTVGVRMALKQPQIKKQWEAFVFQMPVFGLLNEQVLLTEVSRTMSVLNKAGVPIVETVELVAEGTKNLLYKDGLFAIAKAVQKGVPISQAFARQEVFPPIMSQMMSVGEETGKIDEVMMRISTYFESESDQKIKGLSSALEPFILIFLGVIIAFMVFAIVIPIYNLANVI